jgi:hypothetical protein
MVDVHEVSDYFNDILFLTEDGKSGIAVTKEGDIISVFSAVSHDSRLSKLMQMAIAAGGKKLDCFYMDGTKNLGLPDIYKDFGFITDATNPLDESFLGDDYKEWVKNNPDKKVKGVAAMHLSNPNSIENFGEYENSHTTDAPILLGENGYDDMIAVRDKNIENIENPLSYEDYLKNNQAGIDHYEILAPAYTEAIFLKFTDSNGNISVDAIELLNPELLKMIGYRIPTEAKYSIAPLKIVGFTPREMGDVIILPADITLINGSDFDVDKEYCIRKQLNIVEKELDDNKLVEHLFTKLGKKESKEKQATIYKIANDFIDKPYDKKYWKDKGFTED